MMTTLTRKDLNEKPAVLLWSVAQLWQRQRKASLKAIDLTIAQYITLACLYWFKNQSLSVTQAMLAAESKVDIMHTSRILRALESKGLLVRGVSPDDSRAKYVHITPYGEEIAQKGSGIVNSSSNEFFAPLRAREKDFVAIMQLLIQANDTHPTQHQKEHNTPP